VLETTVDSETPGLSWAKSGRVTVRPSDRRATRSGRRLNLRFALGSRSTDEFFLLVGV
jgi:hypothetical protein